MDEETSILRARIRVEKFACLNLSVKDLLRFVFVYLSIGEEWYEILSSFLKCCDLSLETKGKKLRGSNHLFTRGIAKREDSVFELPMKCLLTIPIFFFPKVVSTIHILHI